MRKQLLFPFVLFIASFSLLSLVIPKNVQKKVTKEISKTFEVETFDLEEIKISKDVNDLLVRKIEGEKLFKIVVKNELIGYAYVDKAPSKTDEFDYLILLDKDLIIVKTKVLIYREDYGGEIGSKRWLKQFNGKTSKDKLKYQKDIMAISGATISASSMTIAVNTFLQNLAILHQNKVL
ncbi:FMN-binding protein [Tenacibaculum lutimaris]|uniref:FMN-binding protein n=1 Tax=Tenacibaculum lutimaris TaxID=285258 RepID=A0A420DZW6_9FLAO|nr:FMN-binding protein [Tenacibaculum lutimaris]RKF03390.1 FMN-binding protein [Tenacibaculum lutimaris]